MASIGAATRKSFRIDKWLGLHEAPDGDAKLRYGEASLAENWRVTLDGNLRRRPGTHTELSLSGSVKCLWSGFVSDTEMLLAAASGALWNLTETSGVWSAQNLGAITTTGTVSIFGFSGKAYVLTGAEYMVYDGTTLSSVEGYVPLVAISLTSAGDCTLLETVNKLTVKRRCWLSPNGQSTIFTLPDSLNVSSIDTVYNRATKEYMTQGTDWNYLGYGGLGFTSEPTMGENYLEVVWSAKENDRSAVTGMRFSEIFNGTTDNRVFLYGNGTNRALYSGLDYDGAPRADYFPDLNVLDVGSANTPVTGLIRHYSRLAAFKPDGAWYVRYDYITLADGSVKPAFYTVPINRSLGNEALGQVQLVLNSPRTLCGGSLYEWKNNSSYTANLTSDERQARRISDRIFDTLSSFDPAQCLCFDDNEAQEYYIVCGQKALVHNYASDAWYVYTGFGQTAMVRHKGDLFCGDSSGRLKLVSDDYNDDDGTAINAKWETGSMDFGTSAREKYFAEVFLSCSPASGGNISVTAKSERNSISAGMQTEAGTLPTHKRLRVRLRKFVYGKLVLESNGGTANDIVSSLTVTAVYGGESK